MLVVLPALRSGFRTLARRPGFAAVAILTLALGLGATTAVFSLVHGVVLRPLDLPEPGRLMAVFEDWQARTGNRHEVTGMSTFADWEAGAGSFDALAAALNNNQQRAGVAAGGAAQAIGVNVVSRRYFEVLGVPLARGRSFTADEEVAGKDAVAVVSSGFTQRVLGGVDPIGRTLVVSSRAHTVVGVLPAGFQDPLSPAAEVWLPLPREPGSDDRGAHYIRVLGRLRTRRHRRNGRRRSSPASRAASPSARPSSTRASASRSSRCRTSSSATWSVPPSRSSGRCCSCCSSPASTSRTCSSPAAPSASARWRCARRWGRSAAGW